MDTPTADRRHAGRSPRERREHRLELERLWADAQPREDASEERRVPSDVRTTAQPARKTTAA